MSMTIVKVHEAKTNLSKLIARAEAGEEVVIARGDKPAVKLVPVGAPVNPSAVSSPTRGTSAAGFAENEQAELDMEGLSDALQSGRELLIVHDGKPLAKVVPVDTSAKPRRTPGRLAHLRGNLPSDLFDQPLSDDELDAWEGKYSGDGDFGDGGR